MKRVLFLLVITTVLCAATATARPAPPNLLFNGGFEEGTFSPGGSPEGWIRDPSNSPAVLTWNDTESYRGGRSVKVTVDQLGDARWIQVVPVQPNTLYFLSGWIKTEGVDRGPEIVPGGANISIYGTYEHSIGTFGTRDWRYITTIFDSGSRTQVMIAARVGYWYGRTTGTAWFDDLRLTPIETSLESLVNGHFEEGESTRAALPWGWNPENLGSSDSFGWDREAHSGRWSARIAPPEPDIAMWTQMVTVQPFTNYLFSGWIRTRDVHSNPALQGGASLTVMNPWAYSREIFGTTDWTFVSVLFNSGPQTRVILAARLGFWHAKAAGTAWFDDLRLTRLSQGPIPTPAQQIDSLRARVDGLMAAGRLDQAEGRALTAKLDAAARALARGQEDTAANVLGAFVQQVEALVRTGRLPATDGQALMEAARLLIAQLTP